MQQSRSRVVWIVAIAVALFFFFDPFQLFSGRKIPTTRVDSETRTELADFLAAGPSAIDTVLDLLNDADLVLIGETGYVSQHVTFVQDLIPSLDSAGVHNLLYQYANTEDQDRIDSLLTATTFDERTAKSIMFNHLTVFGFEEHLGLFRAAWQVNRRKSPGDAPFRIIALSNALNYGAITEQEDVEDPAVMQQVFATGVPEVVMARIAAEEILDRGLKAVAFTQIDHAITGFDQPDYLESITRLGFDGVNRMGRLLRQEYGMRVMTAALHGPIRYSRSRTGFGYPTGSIIDTAVVSLPESRTAGFRTAGSPFADVPVIGDVANSLERLTVSGYSDAYLAVAPLSQLTALAPIPGFITESNLADAVRNFPGASPEDATVEDMNSFIAGNAEGMDRVFEEFR